MKTETKKGILLAILAAALYAINSPFSKILLNFIPSTLMAGFLYIGAGLGMALLSAICNKINTSSRENNLTKNELPFTIAMILLDIAAPILLLLSLSQTSAAHVSLLNNFEIVATAIIALCIFKEKLSKKLWLGIFFITLSCCILSFEDIHSLHFSKGSIYVLLAACCWGLENNCTRKISTKDPLQIVLIKGLCSGTGSLLIGFFIGERTTAYWCIPLILLLGFMAYGLSIYFYVYAQRLLGAAKTSVYYAISPFIASILSLIIFQTIPEIAFFIALIIMLIGAWLSS